MTMFIENWGIVISVILLLCLFLLTTGRRHLPQFKKRYILVFACGLLSVVWLISIAADRELMFFNLRSDNLLRNEVFIKQNASSGLGHEDNCHKLFHQISKGTSTEFVSTTCNVLIIDGSSISTRGVDGELLQSILNRQGYSVRVVQLTAIGAGHYERRSLVRRHLKQLEKFYSHPSVNLILMDEIHLLFDNDFLAGIRGNLLTEVSQGFIDINTAILIVKNELISGIDLVNKLGNDLNLYIDIVKEGLLREFHVGWYGRMLSPKQLDLAAKRHTPFGEVRNVEINLALTNSKLTNSLYETCRSEISGSYSVYVPEVHSNENAVYCETGCTGYNFRLFEGINNEYKLSETPHKLFLVRKFSGTTTYQHVTSGSNSLLPLGPVSNWKLLICLPSQPTITRNYYIKFNFLGLAAQSRSPSVFWDHQLIQKHIQEMIKHIPSSDATKQSDRPHDSTVLKRAALLRHQLMGELIENVDQIGRYTTPTLLKHYRSYYDNSCRINSCLVEPQDLKEFINTTYTDEWRDETHLSALGAYRFTTLLTEQILGKNLLR
jgi:hypothetical protein